MSTIYCTRFRKTSPRENKVNTFLSFYQKYILIKPWFSNATQHLLGTMVANNHTTHLCTESLVALVRNMTRGLIPGFPSHQARIMHIHKYLTREIRKVGYQWGVWQ